MMNGSDDEDGLEVFEIHGGSFWFSKLPRDVGVFPESADGSSAPSLHGGA
jgi:hypothetical protein